MCYGNWVWSQTGQDYKGDYDFFLTTDAHSGAHALEIRCTGSDCGSGAKAAIHSQKLHAPVGQAFALSVWSKCDSGQSAYFYTPSSDQGDLIHNLTCNGSWAQNQLTFTSGSSDGEVFIYFYNAGTTSLLLDDAVLTYADGTVPAHTVSHPGTRAVTESGNTVLVDGAPYLALGFFDVPYDALPDAASAGANTVTSLGLDGVADCFNDDRAPYPDRAYDLGLSVLPDSTTTARLDAPDVYPAVIDRFAPYLANIGWYLVDEPDQDAVTWYYIQPDTLVAEHDQARTRTALPVLADLQRASWDSASVDAPYAPAADLFMAEPYGSSFSGITHAMGLFSGYGTRPTWLAQDAPDANLIVPKAYFAIASGATGILYFTWPDFVAAPDKLAAATQAFAELRSLQDVIFGESADADVTAPAGVTVMARAARGKRYILAVDPTGNTSSADFAVSGLADGATVNVLFESRTLTATAGHFTDTFGAVARHVYELP